MRALSTVDPGSWVQAVSSLELHMSLRAVCSSIMLRTYDTAPQVANAQLVVHRVATAQGARRNGFAPPPPASMSLGQSASAYFAEGTKQETITCTKQSKVM